jgi:D-arabinose 1-dehydrogenase-like Zn-dependent alcohol dehydrogenase
MAKMRAAQVGQAKGPFEIVERDVPQPGPGEVLIQVRASGICHSDAMTKDGLVPGIAYPRVPGHEVAGVIAALGSGVTGWKVGQRVGVGWHGGHCGYCDSCRRGEFVTCLIAPRITGISFDGGHAEYMVASAAILAAIPDALSDVEAGPLMCAGVTTYNALRNAGARPADLVAVLGIGGLGHLGVQFAAKMGYRTAALARGKDKEALARELGAHEYIDTQAENPAEALQRLGGAKIVLATVTDAGAMMAAFGGLGVGGKLIVVGVAHEPLQVPIFPLIAGRRAVMGWPSGSSIDSQDTLAFSAVNGVRPMTEVMPLARIGEGYDRMMSGKVRFRAVVSMQA